MSWIKKVFFVVLMIISSAQSVKIYAKNPGSETQYERIISSGYSSVEDISNTIETPSLMNINPEMSNQRNSCIVWDFNIISRESEINFKDQQLKIYRCHLLKKYTRVKRKKNKLGKANFQSYTSDREDLIPDKVTIPMPSRLISNLEGYKKQFERFCSIEITPD